MADLNGSGKLNRLETLLDRVGEKLDKLATSTYLHDERLSRTEALREENQLQWKQHIAGMSERENRIDERIEKLVVAIGQMVRQRE